MQQDTTDAPTLLQEENPSSNDIDFDHSSPEAFVKKMRLEAVTAAAAEMDEGMSIDLLLKMCHGLVTTNREIWERCKPFCCKIFKKAPDASTDTCIFYKVRHMNARAVHRNDNQLALESEPHVMKLAHEIPISLPPEVEWMVATPRPDQDDFMPNYSLLFQRSMLLIDELLSPFLLRFKTFLENQQVALGQVDVWLFHDNEHQVFLKDHFGVTVDYEDAKWHRLFDDRSARSVCGSFVRCTRCGDEFMNHSENKVEDWRTCKTDHKPGCFPIDNERAATLCRWKFPGTIKFNICIETPEERSRLIHFVNFMGRS